MRRPKQTPQATTKRDSDKFILRLPQGMRERIAKAAAQNGRSMNSEVIAALEKHFEVIDNIGLLWDAIEEIQHKIHDLESRGVPDDEH